eukprot:g18515.t1
MDTEVRLKMEYEGRHGSAWYEAEAYRSVSQAAGRLLRHQSDYGCLLLLDYRFAAENPPLQLSSWLRQELREQRGKGLELLQRKVEMGHTPRRTERRASRSGGGVPAVISSMYTFGAPAVSRPPMPDLNSPDHCFPGLRTYTEPESKKETRRQRRGNIHSMWMRHPCSMPTPIHSSVCWHLTGPCPGDATWPQGGGAADWGLHSETHYAPRLQELSIANSTQLRDFRRQNVTLSGVAVATDEPFKTANEMVTLAYKSYDTIVFFEKAWNLEPRCCRSGLFRDDPHVDVGEGPDPDLVGGDYPLLEKHFAEFEHFVSHSKAYNTKTLVHCQAGMNRSAGLCAAYLVYKERIPLVKAIRLMVDAGQNGARLVCSMQEMKTKLPKWRLVDRHVFEWSEGAYDDDPIMVAQQTETLECALVFTGTNHFGELGSSVKQHLTGYCGFDQESRAQGVWDLWETCEVHAGYRDEVWQLSDHAIWPKITEKLSKCSSVRCVGHSLGGAMCDVFSGCINSGRLEDPETWPTETGRATDWSGPQ